MPAIVAIALNLMLNFSPQSDPSPLCLVELRYWCCHQVANEWLIVDCGGEECTGPAEANLVVHYDRTYGSPGFTNEQWENQQDGSVCTYNRVECINGYCQVLPEKITWHCHRVILSGSCQ